MNSNVIDQDKIIKKLIICKNSNLKIEYEASDFPTPINESLKYLLLNRKDVATRYFELGYSEEYYLELINLFDYYNQEILKIIGL